MDRAYLGPLVVLQLSVASWIFIYLLSSLEVFKNRMSLSMLMGNPIANVSRTYPAPSANCPKWWSAFSKKSESISNHLTKLCYFQKLKILLEEFIGGFMANLPEGCQYPLTPLTNIAESCL
jgi:hypothetical protein